MSNEEVTPVDNWGRRPMYQAKVGTMSGNLVILRSNKNIAVDARVEFAEWTDLRGTSKSMRPRWRTGIIWKIEDNRIFINNL